MAEVQEIVKSIRPDLLEELTQKVNEVLQKYSDKDWNYSRIFLQLRPLAESPDPYMLWFDRVDPATEKGRSDIKSTADEIAWGDRHSNELGILEIVSLRVDKALLEASSDDFWGSLRPIVRLVKKESLAQQGITTALWYKVLEVSGEDFDSR